MTSASSSLPHEKPLLIPATCFQTTFTLIRGLPAEEEPTDSIREPVGRAGDAAHQGATFVGWMNAKIQNISCNCARTAH